MDFERLIDVVTGDLPATALLVLVVWMFLRSVGARDAAYLSALSKFETTLSNHASEETQVLHRIREEMGIIKERLP